MAKREKEKYLAKQAKILAQGGRQEDWRPEGKPPQERTEKLSGKKPVHLV
jgi:hypothetical protein